MLTTLVNEIKIMFLRAHDFPFSAYIILAKMVTPRFVEISKIIFFLRSKICVYYADHHTQLNTEFRAYAEVYIYNNRQVLFQFL